MPNSNNPSSPSPSTPALDAPSYKAALEARKPALAALPESRIYRRARLDPHLVHQIAMGAAVKLSAFRPALVAQFGAAAAELIDSLPTSAIAAKQADIELQMANEASDLSPLHRELSEAYTMLMTDATSLANRGHLPKEPLERAREVRGYQALVDSTLKVVSILRTHWAAVTGITPITEAEVKRGEDAALALNKAMGSRDAGALRAPALELRTRALSQVIYEYDQICRMLTYVRWAEDDCDEIVPSLYAGRGRRRTEVGEDDAPDAVARPNGGELDDVDDDSDLGPSPAEPSPNNGGPPFVT